MSRSWIPGPEFQDLILCSIISNPEHRQAFQQQPIVQQQPEVIQQPSMIRQKSNPAQDNNTSFVSYKDLYSRQFLDRSTETPEE